MICKGCLFYILALTSCTYAVKVNMRGSLSLGKEVMDTVSHYLLNGYVMNGRRFLRENVDLTPPEIKSASLCKKLDFCNGPLEKFVNEYVASLGKAIESVFDGILKEQQLTSTIFEKLKSSLQDTRKVLKTANEKITDENEAYIWAGVLKKISSKFQRQAITYIIDKLEADKDIDVIKKKLTQKLVINIATTELRAERKLCYEYRVCFRALGCTRALNSMLLKLQNSPEEKMSQFTRAFYEALPDTTFYSRLNDVTANELQVILNDMAYFKNVPTKEIFTSIQETVENRINVKDTNVDIKKGQDIQLVHIILSDMDYIYSREKNEPFHGLLDFLFEWIKTDKRIGSQIKDVVRNIEDTLRNASEDLILKLTEEVRVFLEITVDP